ncbi:MAG: two-component system C4-dicarboxylate transport sensor histidine kinase DctB [Psychromonas sp.]|jgi:two-component system C4-dicarboxylate transport sensor histidine kinase DctB|uniref:sensor histidine kinase n=1 Tax=Psychromonas sp. TaxID=1884585 RepID=UPI0039E4F018
MSHHRRITLLLIFFYFLTLALSANWLWQFSYGRLVEANQQQLERFSGHLENQLERFAYIPQLLSRQGILIDSLKVANNSAQQNITNHHLQSINNIIGASDTYLLDANGKTIAASNWSKSTSFIGHNFAFRPYFQQAMNDQRGHYFALGLTSGQRGYYFSYPVKYAAEILGVVVIKMDLSSIEKAWSGKEQHFIVTDKNHIIFISSETAWLFHSMAPLSETLKNEILNSRRYLSNEIKSLSFTGSLDKSPALLRLNADAQAGKRYLSLSQTLKNVDWQVRVLTPTTSLLINITMLIVFVSLFYLLLYLVHILIGQKQSRYKEQVLLQAKAKQQLEFQVMHRTSALHAEIDERRKAERALRDTQKELIQSAKLAVLGQLSASISHELNNPLAAIRSYAENAVTFLDLGKKDKVSNNLTRITYLTDRMAKISSQLKAFARKSDGELSMISLQPVLLASYELVKPQLKASQVLLEMDLPDKPVQVKAEPIQLEQIVVNLLSNAIQAMEECQEKHITITLTVDDQQARVEVLDIGTGIKQSDLTLLFEPFFTTKESGLGLGLSISQQIIKNMHGEIWAENRRDQGAKFCISLPLQH